MCAYLLTCVCGWTRIKGPLGCASFGERERAEGAAGGGGGGDWEGLQEVTAGVTMVGVVTGSVVVAVAGRACRMARLGEAR